MKYKCEECGKKVEWEGDGRTNELPKDETGQQYIIPNKLFPYKDIGGGMIEFSDGTKSFWSSLLLMPRKYLCYNCAIKNGYIK